MAWTPPPLSPTLGFMVRSVLILGFPGVPPRAKRAPIRDVQEAIEAEPRWRTQLDIVVARRPRLAEYEVKAQRRIPILRIDRHAA